MINLLPSQVKEAMRYARLNIVLVQYVILTVCVALALGIVMFFGLRIISQDERSLNMSIEEKDRQVAELRPDLQKAEQLSSTITTVASLLDSEIRFSVLLNEIGAVMPTGARLTSLELTGDAAAPLSLTAELDSESLAPVLQQNLINSALFAGADIQQIVAASINRETNTIGDPAQATILVSFAVNDNGISVLKSLSINAEDSQ